VKVTTDNLPGRHFDGTVTRFTYALDTASRTMLVEVMPANPDLALRPGMLVTARIGIEHKESARAHAGGVVGDGEGECVRVHG
jgi:hypothetical protein